MRVVGHRRFDHRRIDWSYVFQASNGGGVSSGRIHHVDHLFDPVALSLAEIRGGTGLI